MISRTWRGWTTPQNAEAYETLLRETILPEIRANNGCESATVFRRELPGETEFVVMTMFTSMEAVVAFAGEEYETAVVPPEARRLLATYEPFAIHYEVRVQLD